MIINDRQYYPSKDVGFYANRVLRDLGLKEPPIFYESVLNYFGLDLHMMTEQQELEFEKITATKIELPAFLLIDGDDAHIFVRKDDIPERQRLSIFHEVGHFDIPWHESHMYLCDCISADHDLHNLVEKEAYEYAAHIIFPDNVFCHDIRSKPVCIETIEELAERYGASFEATAIKYVKTSPEMCAIVYLLLNPDAGETGCPFMIKYGIKSKSFHHYWHKNDPIQYHDMIASCFQDRNRIKGKIPASVFGSSKKHDYTVDLKPYGDHVCSLLYIPGIQQSFI